MIDKMVCLVLTTMFVLNCRAELPSYIKMCDLDDPLLNECIVKHANEAIPHMFNTGYKDLRMVKLLPFVVDKVSFSTRHDFLLQLENVDVLGLEKLQLIDAKLNWPAKKIQISVKSPYVLWLGDYKMNGNLFNQPIYGHGKVNVTHVESGSTLSADIKTVETDGKQYLQLVNWKTVPANKKLIYDFEGLYEGNATESKKMHGLLNGDWKVLRKELKDETDKHTLALFEMGFNSVFSQFPLDELFITKDSNILSPKKEEQ